MESRVLVIKRIRHVLHLTANERDRETAERVVGVYEDGCPVSRSLKGGIEIFSELDFTPTVGDAPESSG